jgi:dual-specificity kinase
LFDTFRSIGCILVELFTGDAIYQTHENREHLAMIEKTIGKIPIPFANKSPTRKYFKNEGNFDWPNIATDEKSKEDVSKLKPLKVFTRQTQPKEQLNVTLNDREKEDFYDLCLKCLQIDPSERITAKEALSHPFFK